MKMIAATADTRSGDRVRNGMFMAGLSLAGISIILDPYISAWMLHQTGAYGIVFADPEGWKNAVISISVPVLTGAWGVVHMMLIRWVDRLTQEDADPPSEDVPN